MVKVGDTVSDIREGKNAGVFTIGVIEGSSEMGVTEAEYEAMSEEQKKEKTAAAAQRFLEAGADAVIGNMSELEEILGI